MNLFFYMRVVVDTEQFDSALVDVSYIRQVFQSNAWEILWNRPLPRDIQEYCTKKCTI